MKFLLFLLILAATSSANAYAVTPAEILNATRRGRWRESIRSNGRTVLSRIHDASSKA